MIVILHSALQENASTDELDTLIQVSRVKKAVEKLGYEAMTVPFSLDFSKLTACLQQIKPTIVFNLVESVNGRGDLIHLAPLILEHLKIPYTGGNSRAFFQSSDKVLAKRLLQSAGIATPSWFGFLEQPLVLDNAPYIIKSVMEDGSIGIDQTSLGSDPLSLLQVMQDRQRLYGGRWFAERYIHGREFNISILADQNGPKVLPAAEIKFLNFAADQFHIVDYAAKWASDSKEYHNTPRSFAFEEAEQPLLAKLQELSLACWQLFEMSGYARVDFRVDEQNQPWVLEVNVNPSLAEDAGFIAASSEAGLSYEDIIEKILQSARRELS